MVSWAHYFECFGVLLAIYTVVRLIIAWDVNYLPKDRPWRDQPDGTPIDTSPIGARVEAVRHEPLTPAPRNPHAFKKPVLVEEKRRQIEKLRFFNKPPPPPPEPPAHEEGHGTLIFI